MAWEEDSCICLNMQLIAILSRIGVITSLPQNQQHLCMSNLRERVANIVQTRK